MTTNHWSKTSLGNLANLRIGRTPPRKDSRYWTDDLTHPFCTIADMTDRLVYPSREGVTQAAIDEGKARLVPAGTLLMSFKLTIGRVGFAKTDLFPNEAIVAIEPDASLASPEFLYYLLGSQDLTGGSNRAAKGATLNSKSLAAIKVLLPSIGEQRRIVNLIESVDAYTDVLRAHADAARTSRTSLLHELLNAESEDWEETTLGGIAEVVSGGTPKTSEDDYWAGEIIWVTPTEVVKAEGGIINDSERKITAEGLANSSAKMLPQGAILLTSRATIGATAMAGVPLSTNQGFASLVAGENVLPRFLMYWCQANTLEFVSRAGGNTFKEISRKKVAAIPITLPPIEEQSRICDLIGSVDRTLESTSETMKHAQDLRVGLLSELLSGVHEIPESYDTMLEAS